MKDFVTKTPEAPPRGAVHPASGVFPSITDIQLSNPWNSVELTFSYIKWSSIGNPVGSPNFIKSTLPGNYTPTWHG
jgi:hypothetical protein